jgi:DNA-binding response OmpR family regulator
VDDEHSFTYLLEVILQRAGYRTLVANDGREGLELIRHSHPDLVILDENMPGMQGSEVYRQMKADAEICDIPVIMHSSAVNLRKDDLMDYIRADAYLPKPSLPREVLDKVRTLAIAHHASAKGPEAPASV